ncbi:TetR/AcrR family transcriptional regulator [Streptomyces sp. NPDC005708]|uniref:TetR/AcrR family transcriptional regulator n=1 Tax=Streptomyces sp. NPDC005708 TaxID=3154564 RepID=UPI0033F4E551
MSEAKTLPQPRERILQAAADLLAEGGRDAVSTRAVSAAARVQAQTIYRHFGDMQGLLNAVARRGYADYLGAKRAHVGVGDPVEQVLRGWDLHIAFALASPAVYQLLYADPRPDVESPLVGDAHAVLLGLVESVAKSGRLRTSVEFAAAMIHSSGVGVALTLIAAQAAGQLSRYEGLSDSVRDAVLGSVLAEPQDARDLGDPTPKAAVHAIALKALLADGVQNLTVGERTLLGELLDRIASEGALSEPTD